MRVLVVEDDPGVRHCLVEILTRSGCEVIAADSAANASAQLRDCRRPPHVAVLDIVLPTMNGLHYAEQLRRELPSVEVIFMTGWLDPAVLKAAAALGPMLIKPFTVSSLLSTVDNLLKRRNPLRA